MIIPHRRLSPEALQGVLEDFIGREGTDYGECEIDRATKINQLRGQLERGEVVLTLDLASETINLLTRFEADALTGEFS